MKKLFYALLILGMIRNSSAQIIGAKLKFIVKNFHSNKAALLKLPHQPFIPVTLQFEKPVNISAIENMLPDGIRLKKINSIPLFSTHVVIAEMTYLIMAVDS